MSTSEPQIKLSDEDRLKQLYGKLPTRSDLLSKKLRDRKYFDSGDYAMSQAGRLPPLGVNVGSQIPHPESIPRGSTSPQKH